MTGNADGARRGAPPLAVPGDFLQPNPANLRGIGLMILAMAAFAVTDAIIKALGGMLPPGQVLMMIGAGSAAVFAAWARLRGERLFDGRLLGRWLIARNTGELVGSTGFLLALVLAPLSTVSAILQATPLVVALGAALVLGERVGPYRWAAIFVGLCGVLLVIAPWDADFVPSSLLALLAVAGLATRDLATRRVRGTLPVAVLAAWGVVMVVPSGAVLLALGPTGPVAPSPAAWGLVAAGIATGCLAYWAIIGAMQAGDVGVVTPFRYTRIVFALILAMIFFGERPGATVFLGAAIIVASGLFTLWREQRRRRAPG